MTDEPIRKNSLFNFTGKRPLSLSVFLKIIEFCSNSNVLRHLFV